MLIWLWVGIHEAEEHCSVLIFKGVYHLCSWELDTLSILSRKQWAPVTLARIQQTHTWEHTTSNYLPRSTITTLLVSSWRIISLLINNLARGLWQDNGTVNFSSQLDTIQSLLGRGNPQLRNCLDQLACWHVWEALSPWLIGIGGPVPIGHAIPWKVSLGCIRKVERQCPSMVNTGGPEKKIKFQRKDL